MAQIFLADYLLLGAVMTGSAFIGCYHAFFGSEKTTLTKLILANRKMPIIPITLSLVVSFQSSVSLLGRPVSVYKNGPIYMLYSVSRCIAALLTAFVYFPVYHRLQLTSVYEYLEIRYQRKVMKMIGSCSFMAQTTVYLSIVLFALSLALNAVAGLDLWAYALPIGIICTLYTAVGGLKAIIWTDVFQAGIMVIGMLVILIQGSNEEGGFSKVWQIAEEGERTKLYNFDPDHRVQLTTWSVCIGYIFNWLNLCAVNQVTVQRILSAKSLRNAQTVIVLTVPILMVWAITLALTGLVLYSRYHDCDPVLTGVITSSDQLLPFYVVRVLTTPGFAGLFVSITFCACLSTFSSGLNSLATVTLQDILKEIPVLSITEKREILLLKLLVVGYGVIIMIFSVVFSEFESILKSTTATLHWTSAPLLGLFTLGMFFKQANWKGGLAGWSVGLIFQLWIGIGNIVIKPKPLYSGPPKTTATCLENVTAAVIESNTGDDNSRAVFYDLYRVSSDWQTLYTILFVIIIGVPVSYFTGGEDQKKLNPKSVLNYREAFCLCRNKIDPEEDVRSQSSKTEQKEQGESINMGKIVQQKKKDSLVSQHTDKHGKRDDENVNLKETITTEMSITERLDGNEKSREGLITEKLDGTENLSPIMFK